MASDPHGDDDAFRWEGDDAPSTPVKKSAATPVAPAAEPLAEGWQAVGKGSETIEEAAAGEPAPLGNVALVSMGLLGGIYLLYTVGWVLGGIRMFDAGVFLVPAYAVIPVVWVAIGACAVWFGATMLLTRHAAVWVRFVWLVAGVFLLVPWPFVMGV
ncbi:DNA polymerase III subunit gamma/tau [Microbacterium dauci]|uniref:DNA polymerase III subunit gamma/tau n=1 Tax=Microbacterium dauci TaxID=3048008 RepID=A0ABT6ZBP5_9MICO|nr:DNA polymerase III subunit gamma/tau [Microbacterium sp. LX3-4]MDJ1113573.1 DNA polymerase III subunit gamma/tau [Microbacterium sp. LX3-4]